MLVWFLLASTVCATMDKQERSPRDLIGQNRLRNNLSIFQENNQDTPSIESQLAQRVIKSYNQGKTSVKQAQSFVKTMKAARRTHGNRRPGRRGLFMKRRRNHWNSMTSRSYWYITVYCSILGLQNGYIFWFHDQNNFFCIFLTII